ncbi:MULTISPECIES: glycosyltransferase [unclassified Clostridium]|uniref:glycosyltransferase family 2 protein n=1 Tax=unclassified Clostridium TaxID=2614128 RepID=UPI001C8CCF46|nr:MULTISPECIES: glycosyltransferase [unclassified Clostridium]MBX9136408.1 glycosyltransferase [Clostridium sp. K12(2020)]MBX9143321.1 glycosyltransferase [Clostridium sp. K13]
MNLISIIVPVYNVEKYLEKCIESILNQTYENIEIILVDDGSTDNSLNICNFYASKDKRIKVIHQENRGVSYARNVGLNLAKGDYIGFVDSDDYIEDNMYEILINDILENDSDISICGFKQLTLDNNIIFNYGTNKKIVLSKEKALEGFISDKFIKEFMYAPWNKLYKRSIVTNVKFRTDLRIGEDLLFVFECLEKSNKISLYDTCKYNYINRENSLMTSKFSEKRLDYIRAIEEISNICFVSNKNIYYDSMFLLFNHKLTYCRHLFIRQDENERYYPTYKEFRAYLIKYRSNFFNKLTLKRKIDYFFAVYAPFIYKINSGYIKLLKSIYIKIYR